MARYVYVCADCGGSVKKYEPTGTELSKEKKAGLHGWSCVKCGRGVKVKRTNA